jgi:hypothetical protein
MRIRFAVQSTRMREARDPDCEKVDTAGRHVRQIELCAQHCEIVIERERARGGLRFATDATNSARRAGSILV